MTKATGIVLADIISSEAREINPDTKIVETNTVTTHRAALFRSFLGAVELDFDKSVYSFNKIKNNGGRQDKSYGLGRVGFPRTEPAVAAQAVSV